MHFFSIAKMCKSLVAVPQNFFLQRAGSLKNVATGDNLKHIIFIICVCVVVYNQCVCVCV